MNSRHARRHPYIDAGAQNEQRKRAQRGAFTQENGTPADLKTGSSLPYVGEFEGRMPEKVANRGQSRTPIGAEAA